MTVHPGARAPLRQTQDVGRQPERQVMAQSIGQVGGQVGLPESLEDVPQGTATAGAAAHSPHLPHLHVPVPSQIVAAERSWSRAS